LEEILMLEKPSVMIIGAGPAGLTTAHELLKHNMRPIVLEQSDQVGGIARTAVYKGYRFDIGGHRFYSKVEEVNQLWHEVLGSAFRQVPRLSRIYYNQRYLKYPLSFSNTIQKLGFLESLRVLGSYLSAQLFPYSQEETFEQWVTNRFGRRLYETFFKSYTEKVWGIPCNEIRAEWAAQRIKGLSLKSALMNALFDGNQNTKTLINEFHYPVRGPGMMWETFQAKIEQQGAQVFLGTRVVRLLREGNRIKRVIALKGNETIEFPVSDVISSMPISLLIKQLSPAPPLKVLQAARALKYRALLIVGLIVNRAEVFPDNWIYIHEPKVKVGRIQNFKNWSTEMVPDLSKTSLGMEYFCNEASTLPSEASSDDIWGRSDAELIALAKEELAQLGLARADEVEEGIVIRQPKAYPVYDAEYRQHLAVIQKFLATISNLQTIGRNGMHRYNNQDHSMLTGLLAARNLRGEKHDLWQVNTERSYYEEFTVKPQEKVKVVETQAPRRPKILVGIKDV
jgi:protoporphyrinogen oxidase